jgi:prepilin-type N-terminal cleavage/methylation domain-containing protein
MNSTLQPRVPATCSLRSNPRVASSHACWKRGGFTLIEMAIVLLITAILAAVAVPKWANALQSFRAATAASRIAADLALAQSAAYSSSAPKTVTFTVGSSQYTIAGVAPLNRAVGTYTVSLTDHPYRCSLVSVWGQTNQQSITFDGYGKPSCGGTIIVAAGGNLKSIVVSAESGLAVVQ